MCLIAFAIDASARHRLLLVGNRDEFHARPSAPLQRWPEAPEILAGRDLEAGGTWIGVSERGRAAVVTNVRTALRADEHASRGLLAADFLRGDADPATAAARLLSSAKEYRPFNLLLFGAGQGYFVSNRPQPRAQAIASGIHALSNATLDTPWPKTRQLLHALQQWIRRSATEATAAEDFEPLFAALADATPAADAALPDTGVGIALERRLSPAFIRGEDYGTRASSVIAIGHDGAGVFRERRFAPGGAFAGETTLRFRFDPAPPNG